MIGRDDMTRKQRQRDELLALCRADGLLRAIDLAFEHFAEFGRDEEIIHMLWEVIERTPASAAVRRRYDALDSCRSGERTAVPSDHAHRSPR